MTPVSTDMSCLLSDVFVYAIRGLLPVHKYWPRPLLDRCAVVRCVMLREYL